VLESPEEFEIINDEYEFILSPVDIEELEKNKGYIEHDYRNLLVPQPDDEYKPVNWRWINPALQKVS